MVGFEKVLTFQPRKSLRTDKKGFEDQETTVISRNGLKIPAHTTIGNNLGEIKTYIKKEKIDATKKPYLIIDEIMFFVDHAKNPQEAIDVLEDLRKMGFKVIFDGIDYTFQARPFTFMLKLLKEAKKNKNWHEIEMSTRCRYCEKRARVTRLWLVDEDGTRRIAPRNYNYDHPGDTEYDPVCGHKHKSYSNKQSIFRRIFTRKELL